MTIDYKFNGVEHKMTVREFQSVRRAESWQHYGFGERPSYGDPLVNTVFLMQNRFTNAQIAIATGTTEERIRLLKKHYGIHRSRAHPITDTMDRIIRSGIPLVRICEMTGLDDRVVKRYAREHGIHINRLFRGYSNEDLALFDVIKDNDELARRLGRNSRSIASKRSTMRRDAKRSQGMLAA